MKDKGCDGPFIQPCHGRDWPAVPQLLSSVTHQSAPGVGCWSPGVSAVHSTCQTEGWWPSLSRPAAGQRVSIPSPQPLMTSDCPQPHLTPADCPVVSNPHSRPLSPPPPPGFPSPLLSPPSLYFLRRNACRFPCACARAI